jgi:hypothetical protein
LSGRGLPCPGTRSYSKGKPASGAQCVENNADPNVWKEAVERYRETLKTRKTVINGLEFAARVNKEIEQNSDTPTGGITVIFRSNLRPGALRRRREDPKPPKQRAEGQ